jgi:hypothetical protein
LNQSIGQLLADAANQESKWRAVRRAVEFIIPIYDELSNADKSTLAEAVTLGDAKAIRGITKQHRAIEELATHAIREQAKALQIKNWSRAPRFLLIKQIKAKREASSD